MRILSSSTHSILSTTNPSKIRTSRTFLQIHFCSFPSWSVTAWDFRESAFLRHIFSMFVRWKFCRTLFFWHFNVFKVLSFEVWWVHGSCLLIQKSHLLRGKAKITPTITESRDFFRSTLISVHSSSTEFSVLFSYDLFLELWFHLKFKKVWKRLGIVVLEGEALMYTDYKKTERSVEINSSRI